MSATGTIEDAVLLESLETGEALLTIPLVNTVAAEDLGKLLHGLATFYAIATEIEVRDKSRLEDEFEIEIPPEIDLSTEFGRSYGTYDLEDQISIPRLLIDHLEIGTPNKLRIRGKKSILKKIYLLLQIAQLSVALTNPNIPAPQDAGGHGSSVVMTVCTPTERETMLSNAMTHRRDLEQQYYSGKISYSTFTRDLAVFNDSIKKISEGCAVVRNQGSSEQSAG